MMARLSLILDSLVSTVNGATDAEKSQSPAHCCTETINHEEER